MAQTISLSPGYYSQAVDEWFVQEPHPRASIVAARQSRMPVRTTLVHQAPSHGTSMLHSGRDSLVALTGGNTASTSTRAATAIGEKHTARQRILEPDTTGALQVPPIRTAPEYQCTFWFLGCSEKFYDEQLWSVHMTNHFRPAGPPAANKCCFCGEISSWRELLNHLKRKHFILGHRVAHGRPDFALINHLRDKEIISKQDWKDLQGTEVGRSATESLTGYAAPGGGGGFRTATTPYMVTYNPRAERRRDPGRR